MRRLIAILFCFLFLGFKPFGNYHDKKALLERDIILEEVQILEFDKTLESLKESILQDTFKSLPHPLMEHDKDLFTVTRISDTCIIVKYNL